MSEPAALGFRAHSGWAAAVAVAGSPGQPLILDRRRIETADPAIGGSKQPFHAAEPLSFAEAQRLIERCRSSSGRLADSAVSAMLEDISRQGYRVAHAGILTASGRPLPGLDAILKSHALIHTAEGEFFREVLIEACEHRSLVVATVKEREVWDRSAASSGLSVSELERGIGELGRRLGPPWRQDEKMASLAAWLALALE